MERREDLEKREEGGEGGRREAGRGEVGGRGVEGVRAQGMESEAGVW